MTGSNSNVFKNMFWKLAERLGAQIITLVVSIVLARLLEPSHYGVISIVMIFITIANVFVSDGVGSALIQKKDADAYDFASVLYFNIFISIILYSILFVCAPFITAFFGEGYEILTPVLRVLGLRLIFSAVNSIQQAYVSKKMLFKLLFIATLFGTIVSAFIGIFLAYRGFGVWALVAQYMTNTTIDTIVLAIVIRKRPKIYFSFQKVRQLLKFGLGILGTNLIIALYQEIRAVIIGKKYSSTDLAFYDKGKQFPSLLVTNINSSISTVLFAQMSSDQNDINKIKEFAKNLIRYGSLILFPLMLGMTAVAEPVVEVLLTSKWLPCVVYIKLFCLIYLFQPIHAANIQVIKALGKGKLLFKLEMIKKIIEFVVLLITMFISVKAMAIGLAIMTTLFTVLNAAPNKKLIHYSFFEQVGDFIQPLIMSGFMFIAIYFLKYLSWHCTYILGVQIILGVLVYILMGIILKNKEMFIVINMVRNKLKKRREELNHRRLHIQKFTRK